MKIPGLIASAKEDAKLTNEQLQNKKDSLDAYLKSWIPDHQSTLAFDQQYKGTVDKLQAQTIANVQTNMNNINETYPTNDMNTNTNTYYDAWMKPTSAFIPFDGGGRGLKYNPPLGTSGYLSKALNNKSEFENILDSLFTFKEKEEFLINLGFEFYTDSDNENWMKREIVDLLEKVKVKDAFDKIFLREMTIKFKNLLISKNSLKMKL